MVKKDSIDPQELIRMVQKKTHVVKFADPKTIERRMDRMINGRDVPVFGFAGVEYD